MRDKPVILVVDDLPQGNELLAEQLVPHGYEIVKATNGEEALEKLSGNQIDLILLDVMMPGMDGFEVTRRVRQDNAHRLIPIILVTALQEPEDRVKGIEAGCDDFISKPFDTMELLARIRSLLKVKAYNELMNNYRKELESEVTRRTEELEHAFENMQQDIAERKRAEEALRESEEKFRRFFMTSRDCVFITSKDGTWIDMNDAAVELFGYSSRDELMQVKLQDIYVNPEERTIHTSIIAKRGYSEEFPVDLLRKDGTVIHTLITSVALYDAEKNVIGFQGTIRNITEHRQAEAEREKMLLWQQGINLLQQSLLAPTTLEEKLRSITDSIVSLFDADFSRIWLIQPGDLCKQGCIHADVDEEQHICRYPDRCLHLLASSGRYTHTDGKIHRRVPFGSYKIGRIASDDDFKFLTNDVQNDPRVHNREWARELGLVSFVGYRLSVPGGKTLGVLALFSKHPISSQQDAILDGLSSTVALVIQRDVAEKSLRESEEKHRLLFDSAGDVIFVHDAEARMLAVNLLGCERLGYTHAELMSMTINQVNSQAEAPYASDRVARVMEHGHLTFETVHQRKDGSLIPTNVIARLITWDGQPAIMSICRDITARKRAEEALKLSEQKYHNIFENVVEGIFQTTKEGCILTANPVMARMYGYSSPEELIETITDIGRQVYVNSNDRDEFIRILQERGTITGFEVHQKRKDGSTFWASINARAVKDEAGNLLCTEGIIEDITSRKIAEEALNQAIEKLRKNLIGTIRAISLTVEIKDPYTAGHQRRVSNLARNIAQEMGFSKDAVDTIRMAGVIHDIGKISVPAEILAKPGKITDLEMSLIKVHSQTGYDILKDVGLPYPIAEMVYQHHERLDGSGYPQGLKNGQILLESQILIVADVTEAISSHRPYRAGHGIDAALEEIEKNKGILYDAHVVEACLKLFREKGFEFE